VGWGLEELAAATGLSVGLLRKEIRRGALPVTRIGRRVLVLDEDWRAYVAGERDAGNVGKRTR
jgi:hypothetical protein